MLFDNLARGAQLALLLLGQFQLNNLLYAGAPNAAGYAAVNAGLAVLPLQQDGDGQDTFLVPEDS